jgi:hypothetical protein
MEPLSLWKMKETGETFTLSTGTVVIFHPENQVHDLCAMKLRDFRKLYEEWLVRKE